MKTLIVIFFTIFLASCAQLQKSAERAAAQTVNSVLSSTTRKVQNKVENKIEQKVDSIMAPSKKPKRMSEMKKDSTEVKR